jgi:hypothetical protein
MLGNFGLLRMQVFCFVKKFQSTNSTLISTSQNSADNQHNNQNYYGYDLGSCTYLAEEGREFSNLRIISCFSEI